jgi:uncharacterized protein
MPVSRRVRVWAAVAWPTVPNALAQETSPYLLQHRDNPVDWLPWGETALSRAREQDRPLLVSIGYSACHWCHVMERECFEDEGIAAAMNESFVCVKVDREERPDVDALYMDAVQAMTGQGGWPLNVFLTPEQVPFFGGTYFPPRARPGMPSWPQVLRAAAEAWDERRDEIRASGARIVEHLRGGALLAPSEAAIRAESLDEAVDTLSASFDSRHGGFGGAPKFPPASTIEFLLARGALGAGTDAPESRMALSTLRAMARGGIFDQVGGGFARYAVDATWTVPHFEKMLYDNALLARAYLHAWQLSGEERLLRTARETLNWALREMRAPEGGFYAALDADSEGVEGRYYVWSVKQLRDVLGEDGDAAIAYFGATERGNFDGTNVLEARGEEPEPALRESIRARLLDVREGRVRPGLDDKRLTAWNALMIAALADAGAVLAGTDDTDLRSDGRRYLDAASTAAGFVLDRLRDADGRLLRSFKDDRAHLPAYLEDHAFLLEALLVLYEATFDERWFLEARSLADTILERFSDPELGGFFSTASDHEALVARRKDLEDHPIPAGASSAALGLLRLAALTGEHDYEREAARALALSHELAVRHPTAFGHLLQALAFHTARVREVALVGTDLGPLLAVLRSRLRPALVLAGTTAGGARDSAVPLLEGREPVGGLPAAYVCEGFACRRPVTDPAELAALL